MSRAGKFFYAALRYSMWSVGIVWIIFACHYGYAGKETIVNTIATYILYCCMVMFTDDHFLSMITCLWKNIVIHMRAIELIKYIKKIVITGKYLPKTKDLNLLYILSSLILL